MKEWKWVESEWKLVRWLVKLFGTKESGKKVKEKIHLYFLNDINTPTLKIDVIFF